MTNPPLSTPLLVRTEGFDWFPAIFDYIGDEDYTNSYMATTSKYPHCWTDGICWAFNQDNEPSDPVIEWKLDDFSDI